jgi:nucleotide-binding universal stress UspA family protein
MARGAISILVPLDFSPVSIKVLRKAAGLADLMGASLTLLHVRPISDIRAAIAEGREDLFKGPPRALPSAMKRHYAERLAALGARFGTAAARLASGRASREIVRAAKGFDLVVMGRTGRGGISGLLGGTTHKVLAACPVPVVVVPT